MGELGGGTAEAFAAAEAAYTKTEQQLAAAHTMAKQQSDTAQAMHVASTAELRAAHAAELESVKSESMERQEQLERELESMKWHLLGQLGAQQVEAEQTAHAQVGTP